MCKAKDYTEQLLIIYSNINNDVSRLVQEQQKANDYIMDILHIIENENFNASEGYILAKKLKDARIERRSVKNELNTLYTLKNTYINKNEKELQIVYANVKNQDKLLKECNDKKIYKPRVLESTNLKLVACK